MLDNLFESLRRLRPIKRLPRTAARPAAWEAAGVAAGVAAGALASREKAAC